MLGSSLPTRQFHDCVVTCHAIIMVLWKTASCIASDRAVPQRIVALHKHDVRIASAWDSLAWPGLAWPGLAWPGKARQGKARQGKARQGEARQGKARQGKTGISYIRQARHTDAVAWAREETDRDGWTPARTESPRGPRAPPSGAAGRPGVVDSLSRLCFCPLASPYPCFAVVPGTCVSYACCALLLLSSLRGAKKSLRLAVAVASLLAALSTSPEALSEETFKKRNSDSEPRL